MITIIFGDTVLSVLQISKKVWFFGKNERWVRCGTHKCHNRNLVTNSWFHVGKNLYWHYTAQKIKTLGFSNLPPVRSKLPHCHFRLRGFGSEQNEALITASEWRGKSCLKFALNGRTWGLPTTSTFIGSLVIFLSRPKTLLE